MLIGCFLGNSSRMASVSSSAAVGKISQHMHCRIVAVGFPFCDATVAECDSYVSLVLEEEPSSMIYATHPLNTSTVTNVKPVGFLLQMIRPAGAVTSTRG